MARFIFTSSKASACPPWLRHLWAFALAIVFSSTAFATVPVAQTFFVPFPETDFQNSLKAIDTVGTAVGNSLKTVISIVVPTAGTVIVYDQWEDGYEADQTNPTQSSTQIWGDGDPTNGSAPGYPSDILPAGAVITLNNNIAMPRAATTLAYDGRDRIGATKAIAVTRAGWAITPGTVLASACEVYDTRKWGTSFNIPVGTNTTTQQQFSYSSLHIIASQNGTVVTVDKDGNGTVDVTQTLNLGDSMFVNGGISAGAVVNATHPVEVHELTGRIGSTYQSRTFAIRPTAQWASSYFAPATTTLASEIHNIYTYNPGASAITVSYETQTGSGTFSVPAKGNYEFHMPMNSGGHFFTASGAPFYAVGANDAGGAATVNQTHDWGYALLPESALTTSVVTSWAPGSDDLVAPLGVPDQNGSAVWVTPTRDTIVYVNYSGDLTVGPNTAPDTSKYNVAYTLKRLQSQTIYNATTLDMTKSRIYTTDGTTIATAWGEDSSKASAGAPCLDMGTTIIPFPLPVFLKTATLVNDLNSDGKIGTGDTVEYALTLRNDGVVDLPNALIEDTVPAGTTYVPGSTTLNGSPYADDVSPATIFPLDNGGVTLPAVPSGNSIVIKFRVTINAGATNVTNTASASSGGLPIPLAATVGFAVLTAPTPPACTVTFSNSSGLATSSYAPGASVYVTVTNPNANQSYTTIETVTAVVTNPATGDQELITLTETGANTGVFRNTSALPSSTTAGILQQDGTLYALPGQTLNVAHTDPVYGGTCTNTATVSVPSQTKYLYLSDPSQALDRVDPVATNDLTTATTATMGLGSSTIVVSATSSGTNANGSSLTFSHTPGTGSNQLLMVAVGMGSSSQTGTAGTVSGVTYGGTAMTQVGTIVAGGTTPGSRIYLYELLSPAAGPQSVVVSTSAGSSITASATTFNNVDQTTPMGSFVSSSATSSNPAPSATVTSATGELVYSVCAIDYGGSVQTIATGSGQTELWNVSSFTYVETATSTKPGAASVSLSYTAGDNTQEYALGAVALKPAPGGITSTTFTQAPAMATAFTIPAGTSIGVTAYPTSITGTMPVSPTISAVLKKGTTYAGATTVTTIATPAYNSGAGTLTWTSAALGSAVTVNPGEFIYLDITTTQSGVSFQISYDSTTAPSKITLPTNTVIQIPSYGLYDAAYPGGSLVTSIGNGKTVYVRASVTDPFGTLDISSLDVAITDPSASTTTHNITSSVSDNGTTKIYEYAWMSGLADGAYSIQVKANEGTEGINATSTLPIQVVSTDLGTPSTTTFTDSSGNKVSSYTTTGPVYIQVIDRDQNTNSSVAETVTAVITTANGDKETITLTETGVNTGIFRSTAITTNTSSVTQGNGALNVVAGTGLSVVYIDPNDPSDTSSDNASIAAAPGVTTVSAFKTLVTPASGKALVGDTVTYNIQVTNPGTLSLATVSLSDTFPAANLLFQSATVAPTTTGSGTLNWSNVGPLSPGQSISIQAAFTALTSGATVTNSASVAGTASFGPTSAIVGIDNPNVTVTKTVLTPASGPAYVGDNMTYRIVVHNGGSTTLTTVPLQDQFPGASLSFVSSTGAAPDSAGYGSLLWNNVGPIAPAASKTYDVTFKVLAASTLSNNTAVVNGAVDSNGNSVPSSQSTATLQLVAFNLSGHVYDDANGLNDSTVNGTGTNAGGTLYANLLDGTNTVVQTVAVAADGTYSFSGLAHNTSYSVLLSINQGVVGNFTPAVQLPAGWVTTGEHLGSGAGDDGSPDGVLAVSIASADVSNANFGIDRLPTANGVTALSQLNPGGITQVSVPTLSGTDPEDASVTSVYIADLPADGTLYYNGSLVTAGQTISGYDPTKLKVDPADGSVTVTFNYAVIDAAGVLSPTASVSMPFTALDISGNVFNDANALTDNSVNGTGTDAGGSLYALLVAGGSIADSAQVAPDGSYGFSTVVPNTSYTVVLSALPGVIGDPAPSATLPANWISTGEHVGAGAGSDGTPDGSLAVAVTTSSVTDVNFGIGQTGTLSGHLYMDTNGNGTQDGGEPNLPNINIVVTDHNGAVQTVVTDANGNWTATLPVGTASIHVDSTDPDYPAGSIQTQGTDPTLALVTFAALTPTTNDGYYVPAVVSGHAYIDTNGNGTQDPGEPNLPNVDVNLTNSNGDPLTVATDANGNWTAFVPPGVTIASVDQSDPDFISAVPAGFTQTEGNISAIFIAVAGTTTDAGSDGYFIPGTVGGHLYVDTNGNGTQDPGEPNLPSVPVVVTDVNGVTQTVSTDFNGDWVTSVAPGTTSAKVDTNDSHFTLNVPAGYVQSEGTDPSTVTAVANTFTFTDNDGYFLPALVSGHLYVDTNGNGVQNGTEPGLANVDVLVTDSNGIVHTVSTNANGDWTAAVPPGSTSAKVSTTDPDFISAVPPGYVQTEGTDPTVVLAVASLTTSAGNDGYFNPATVTGHLYVDTNGNGTQDPGEPNLPNVDVTVTNSNGVAQTVTTDASGNWTATVPPGSTTINVDTTDPDFTATVLPGYVQTEGTNPVTVVAVASTSTSSGRDGYYVPATLTGHLYVDSNGNGTQDPGEPNLANVDVVVTDSNGAVHTVSTNAGGNWTLSVPPGSTTAKVSTSDPDFTAVVTAGYTQTQGVDPTTVVAVAGSTTSGGIDGYKVPALQDISGQVRFDSKRSGSFLDNDKPLPGFNVRLYTNPTGTNVFDPVNDVLLATLVTDANGEYHFTGYPNGNYIVVESPPNASLINTNDKDGNNDRAVPVAIAGASSTQNDFLEFSDPQGWFYDTDTGAIIPGGSISVTSTAPGGAANLILDGSSGEYSWITNGVAGDYTMVVTVPPGYTLDPSRPAIGTPLVPHGLPDPVNIGSDATLAGTDLQNYTAAANPWYLTFTLQANDPHVMFNNIPLLRTGCPVSFNGWKTRNPLGGLNGPTDNPTGGDFTNLEKFAFCFNASSGVNSICPLEIVVNGDGTIDALVRRLTGAVGLTYELEYISDLSLSGAGGAGWTVILSISPNVTSNGDGTETATYQNLAQIPALAGGQGFVRIKLTESSTGTTVRTKASGWSTRALTIGCQSCGDPFLSCPVFTGKVDAASGSTVDVTTAAGGQSVAAQFVAGRQYFIEVASGTNAGQRWEVDEAASTASTIAIDLASPLNTLASLPANLAGDHIELREHLTMNDVFPPTKFHATNLSTTADRILISAPGTGAYTIYWLFNNFGSPKWVDAGNATFADVGGTILNSCQGVYIHPKAGAVSLVQSGQVRQNAAACPLKTGPNMISGGWPMNQSPSDRLMTVANGFTGNPNPLHADKVLFWAGDDTSNLEAYISHFELNAGGRQFLTEMSDAALTNENSLPLFKALRANFIQSVAGKSDWVMPLPWTP